MAYVLTEEEQFLKESAQDVFKKTPISLLRDLRDKDDENGFSVDLWNQMIDMGWPGLAVSEELGGLDLGLKAVGILMEASGRTLSASPLLSVVLSTKIFERHGSPRQKEIVQEICESGRVIATAVQEDSFYHPESPECSATQKDGFYHISGAKDLILDGHIADSFIVSARTDSGLTCYLIDKASEGVSLEKEFMMDSRFYCRLLLENVKVDEGNIVGAEGKGKKVVDDITHIANALLSAELVGVMSEAFDRTMHYLKERRQFGKEIGSFQALQHRAADLYGEIELAKTMAIKALVALDDDNFMAPAFCSMAKAKCIKVAQLATNEGIQMFGGIGMTDDEEIGFFLKRSRVAAQLFGGYSFHLDRFARMSGY